MDNKYDIELLACRGRPVTLLTYVLAALRGADELKYQYLYSKGVSFLSATNVAQANTILDGDKTEPRARIFLTFNTTMVIEDLATTEVEQVDQRGNQRTEQTEDQQLSTQLSAGDRQPDGDEGLADGDDHDQTVTLREVIGGEVPTSTTADEGPDRIDQHRR